MHLDPSVCRRARLARDPRFDGRFFVGVRTTGVFCRPICPAVAPSERNVEYYQTAAAATESGFRACLRCRPECAPGTPAWSGVSATIARALRLIADGALEDDGVEKLAGRLGVGPRHLRRLFLQHLGASPIAVAQTRRLLSAKQLIDATDLPLTVIALAAGYGSIRRFNAAFLASYGRSPRELRRHRARPAPGPARERSRLPRYSFRLSYRPPFDWGSLLAFIGKRAIPGVEAVDGGVYRRSVVIGPDTGVIEVAEDGPGALRLDVDCAAPSRLLQVVARARRAFDLDADPMAIDACLSGDPLLRPLVAGRPGMRVPGAWEGFELSVRAVLGQQVSVAAATTLAGRLVARFGQPLGAAARGGVTHVFPTPKAIAGANVSDLGVPAVRGEALRALAVAVQAGEVSFDGDLDGAAFRDRVRRLPGIGEWTAEYMALRALGDPDAFPAADLGLLRATGLKSRRELAARSEAWRPWRAYAALHLWAGAREGDGNGGNG